MTAKLMQAILCILVMILLLSACKAPQNPPNITNIKDTETVFTEIPAETIPADTKAKRQPKPMELPDTNETQADSTPSQSVVPSENQNPAAPAAPVITESTEATTGQSSPEITETDPISVMPECTESSDPYGNGPNATKDDEL